MELHKVTLSIESFVTRFRLDITIMWPGLLYARSLGVYWKYSNWLHDFTDRLGLKRNLIGEIIQSFKLVQKIILYLPARSTRLTIEVLVIICPASFLPFWMKLMATIVCARLKTQDTKTILIRTNNKLLFWNHIHGWGFVLKDQVIRATFSCNLSRNKSCIASCKCLLTVLPSQGATNFRVLKSRNDVYFLQLKNLLRLEMLIRTTYKHNLQRNICCARTCKKMLPVLYNLGFSRVLYRLAEVIQLARKIITGASNMAIKAS